MIKALITIIPKGCEAIQAKVMNSLTVEVDNLRKLDVIENAYDRMGFRVIIVELGEVHEPVVVNNYPFREERDGYLWRISGDGLITYLARVQHDGFIWTLDKGEAHKFIDLQLNHLIAPLS